MKRSKRERKCKTCRGVFRYKSKNEKNCPPCRPARGIRRCLPKLMEEQGRICPLCDKTLPEEIDASIHVDHFWPVKFGGTDDYENLQAVHIGCNRKKNATIALEGHKVVKDILCEVVDGSRVSIKGTRSDCCIILDDNKRKPICRLWVKRKRVYLGVLDENKIETKHRIGSFEAIRDFADEIRAASQRYLTDEQ